MIKYTKLIISIILVVLILTTATPNVLANDNTNKPAVIFNHKYGDINFDGNVNINDATYLQEYFVGLNNINLNYMQKRLVDLNYDEIVDIRDVSIIQRYALGINCGPTGKDFIITEPAASHKIYVAKDGSKDFTSVVEAAKSIKNASKNNVYNIYIEEGEYDILEELGGDDYLNTINEKSTIFSGFIVPDYVNLIGVGNRDKVHLFIDIPHKKATEWATRLISPVNIKFNSELHNLTITGKNTRYAVHDDSNNDRKVIVENCKIIHYKNSNDYNVHQSAYGAGCGGGADFTLRDSTIIGITSGIAMHNNYNFKRPANLHIYNCKIGSSENNMALSFGSVENNGIENQVEMNNCRLLGYLNISNNCTKTYESAWRIKGYGNTSVTKNVSSTFLNNKINFYDETAQKINGSGETISAGSAVALSDNNSVVFADSHKDFYGIAMEDIESGKMGYIQFAGYYYGKFTVGKHYTVSKGQLVESEENPIGYINCFNNLLLYKNY